MQYSPIEQELLSALERTDFKNLSKNDFLSFTSRLGDVSPEVAKEILAQYPQLVNFISSTTREYLNTIDKIIASEEKSFDQYCETARKGMDNAAESRRQFYDFLKQVRADYSKCLENPNLSPEERAEIFNRLDKLVKMAAEKDAEIRNHEKEIKDDVDKKESEKRASNWKLLGAGAVVCIAVIGIGASVLAGKFDLNLPTKS